MVTGEKINTFRELSHVENHRGKEEAASYSTQPNVSWKMACHFPEVRTKSDYLIGAESVKYIHEQPIKWVHKSFKSNIYFYMSLCVEQIYKKINLSVSFTYLTASVAHLFH